jgi:hypothetical protein
MWIVVDSGIVIVGYHGGSEMFLAETSQTLRFLAVVTLNADLLRVARGTVGSAIMILVGGCLCLLHRILPHLIQSYPIFIPLDYAIDWVFASYYYVSHQLC